MITIALTLFCAGSFSPQGRTGQMTPPREGISVHRLLSDLRRFLSSCSRERMQKTTSSLSSAELLRLYVILNHICRRGHENMIVQGPTETYSGSMREFALAIDEITRRLQWLMEGIVWPYGSVVKTGWWLQYILQGCERWLLPYERAS